MNSYLKYYSKRGLTFAFFILFFSFFSSAQKRRQEKNNLTEEQRINLTYIYFNASKEKILGNTEKAADLFAQCLRIDDTHSASMYELANIYLDQKKFSDALFFAEKAAKRSPENIWFQLLLAEVYERLAKYEEASEVYKQLMDRNPERVDFYFNLAQVELYRNKPGEAIKVYDKIESIVGINKELAVQKERLYLKLNKVEKAAQELENLIQKFPNDLDGYSLLVELYQVNNESEKAYEVIKRMQQIAPNSAYVFLALAEYYRQKGEKEKSFENLRLAFGKTDIESEVKIKVLGSYLALVGQSPEMMEQALVLAKALVETHPGEAMANAVYGDFLSLDKKYEEARKSYRASIAIDNKNFNVWQQLLFVESQLNDFEAMLSESEEALTLFPSQPIIYLLNGVAKSQSKKHEEAIKTLMAGSKLVVDNDAQLVEFYSNLGDNFNTLKNYAESDKYYDKALAIDPKNVFILNNYSYYLSLREEKLERAAEMSKLSNELSEANPNFLDTYAWILYKQKKYQDAKLWLERAFAIGGDKNDTILEHYGDVLFQLGDINRALEYWQKAKTAGPGSDLLIKKIAEKKLYE